MAPKDGIPPSLEDPLGPKGMGQSAVLATALAAFAASSATHASDPQTQSPPHPTAADRDEQIAKEVERQKVLIAEHRQEVRDAVWAPAMEEEIDSQVSRYEGGPVQGHYDGVECLSKSCVATFSWRSRAEAQSEMRGTLERIGPVPCGTSLTLPPVQPGNEAPYKTTVYLECTGDRRR